MLAGDGRPGADTFVAALPYLRVVDRCDCGCATVYLQHIELPERPHQEGLFAEAAERTGARMVLATVDKDRGFATCLEVYSGDGASGVTFPPVQELDLLPPED